MFGAYVRFKCNYAALGKSSDNQQQHLLLGQRRIIGNTMVYQDFGKFNSLKNTLTDIRSNMSLSLCLLLTLMSNT